MFLNQRTSLSLSSDPGRVLMSQGMWAVSPASTLTTSTLSRKLNTCYISKKKGVLKMLNWPTVLIPLVVF